MLHPYDSTNSRTVTAANLEGRKAVLERVRKEKKHLMHMKTASRNTLAGGAVSRTCVLSLDSGMVSVGRVLDALWRAGILCWGSLDRAILTQIAQQEEMMALPAYDLECERIE